MTLIISGFLVSASVVDFDFSLFAYLFFRSNSNYLPVSVSACYWASLPGSSRSLGAATSVAIGFGMKFLMLCFVFDSLLSGVAAVGVVLDLVFLACRTYLLMKFAIRQENPAEARLHFEFTATGQRKSRKAFGCFRCTTCGFKMLASLDFTNIVGNCL